MKTSIRIADKDIAVSEIRYAESYGNYVKIFCNSQSLLERMTLTELESLLMDMGFLRCHRRHIVNGSRVVNCHPRCVELDDGSKVPLSRTYESVFK